MIQLRSVLVPADNSGARNLKVIGIPGSNKKKAHLGDIVTAVVDRADPNGQVKDSEKVRIEFTSTVGFHDFVIDEFQAATKKVKVGESTFVEFIANKKGIFEYYCSVGTHRQQGMKGKLIVE
jgi:plastocyanin